MAFSRPGLISVLTIAAGLLAVTGCSSDPKTLDVNVTFVDASRIAKGSAVTFNDVRIGEVTEINPGDGGQQVVLSLDPDKSGIVQSNAAAIITYQNPPTIRIANSSGPSESIAAGATLRGLSSPLEETAWQAGKAISSVQQVLQQAASSFESYINSDEWKRTQQDVEKSLNDLGRQSADAAEQMRGDIEKMMRDLETQTGKTAKEAEKHFGELERELRKFSEDGQKELSTSIQRLLDTLKQAMQTAEENRPMKI